MPVLERSVIGRVLALWLPRPSPMPGVWTAIIAQDRGEDEQRVTWPGSEGGGPTIRAGGLTIREPPQIRCIRA